MKPGGLKFGPISRLSEYRILTSFQKHMTTLAFGFTGAFGSGCTTSAKYLQHTKKYHYVSLSQVIKDRWKAQHPDQKASRQDLQKLGDFIREHEGDNALVDAALTSQPPKEEQILAIDGIRNTGEIERLRQRFGFNFTLIAVISSKVDRWNRIGQTSYLETGLTKTDFDDDDERDWEEEDTHGQQVRLCVDKADILLDNADSQAELFEKLLNYVGLVTGEGTRAATQQEIFMNMAFSASHSSKCLKRHVGAIVVDTHGRVVGVGFNENPLGTLPCAEEPEYHNQCYRDILRNAHFADLSIRGARCPRCGENLPVIQGPPWKCASCAAIGKKSGLEGFFFPDRAMSWCTAVHAELWALLAAGERARDATLYTTTFPCFQCAEKLIQMGVTEIYFTEVYPDPHSGKRLELAGITLFQFEGVRSISFERIFSRSRPA